MLKQLSGFTATIVVNAFIDPIEHPIPQGPWPPSKKLSGYFYGFLLLFCSSNVHAVYVAKDMYLSKFVPKSNCI